MASSYTLGRHFESFVAQLIASGRYSTSSEVMRDGLRLLEEREQLRLSKLSHLRQSIEEGERSGPGIDADTVLAQLEARYSQDG